MKKRFVALMATTCIGSVAIPSLAFAQDAAEDADREEIVVTGTFIRGVAPAGTESITLSQQDIKEIGGITTYEVLAQLPQLSFFNQLPGNNSVGQLRGVNQPRIHGLPALILLDGHRIASAVSAGSISVDPSIIPTGIMSSIEIVPDGGSATYGSDAVGGVVNMTTIRKFDGVKIDGSVGFADSYTAFKVNGVAGKSWDNGSVYAAYAFNKSNAVFGTARPWIVRNPLAQGCGTAGTVINPAATVGGVAFPIATFTYTGVDANGRPTGYAAGAQGCNRFANETFQPAEKMHSVFTGLSQQVGIFEVDLRGFYSIRKSVSYNDFSFISDNVAIPVTNPFRTLTPAQIATPGRTVQNISLSLAPAAGRLVNPGYTTLKTWGASGEFKVNLDGNYQARLLANHSQAYFNASSNAGVDSGLLTAALARTDPATALNPYNVTATPGSILAAQQIASQLTLARSRDRVNQVRLVVDGSLFKLPAGDVKVAVGGELQAESFLTQTDQLRYEGTPTAPRQFANAPRQVLSAFGELEIPLISPESNGPIHALHLSAAGRFDRYSDFGETFNPRFGVTLKPVEWVTFRGTYGKSFVAPSLQELYAAQTGNVVTNAIFLPGSFADPDAGKPYLLFGGGNRGLKPQKAKTWTLGFDLTVPSMEGLKASLTYYDVNFIDLLGAPSIIGNPAFYTDQYKDNWIKNPTYAQAIAFAQGVAVAGAGITAIEQMYGPNRERIATSPVYVLSNRRSNLGAQKTSGLDFSLDYKQPVSFGSFEFGIAGNYILTLASAQVPGGVFTDDTRINSIFNGTAKFGVNSGNFRFTTTLLHTHGFNLPGPPTNSTTQTKVKDYNTVNAFFSYSFKEDGYLQDTELSLNVTNVFNVRPPVNLSAGTGYQGGNYLLRTIQLGFSKKF